MAELADAERAKQAAQAELVALLQRAAEGDGPEREAAWQDLAERYTRRVYGLLLNSCGDRDLAEELTQQTFVKLVQKLDGFSGYAEQGRFEPWLFRVAMNGLRDEMRRRKRQARPVDMSPGASASSSGSSADGETSRVFAAIEARQTGAGVTDQAGTAPSGPLENLAQQELEAQLRDAVGRLSAKDQEVLHLRHTAGLSFQQIADTLEQPLGTVLARGHRAVKKLRLLMEELDPDRAGLSAP